MKKILTISVALLLGAGAFAQSGNPASSWWERIISGGKAKKENVQKAEEAAPVDEPAPATAVQEEVLPKGSYDVSIALVLPFAAESENPHYPSFDFYSGVVTAANRLGIADTARIKLNVFDNADGLRVPINELANNDIIIGPISASQVKVLSARLRNQKYIISPLDQSTAAFPDSIPVIQFATPSDIQYKELAKWAGEGLSDGDSLVVLINSELKEKCAESMLEVLAENQTVYTELRCAAFENVAEILAPFGHDSHTRRFLIASENEEFCKRVLNILSKKVLEGIKIETFCTSKARVISMPVEEKCSCDIHITTSYFIDDNRDDVAQFEQDYINMYGARPNSFAYQGYDILNYFVQIARTFGPDWADSLVQTPVSALQSEIRFENGIVGYINTGVRRVQFNADGTSRQIN